MFPFIDKHDERSVAGFYRINFIIVIYESEATNYKAQTITT